MGLTAGHRAVRTCRHTAVFSRVRDMRLSKTVTPALVLATRYERPGEHSRDARRCARLSLAVHFVTALPNGRVVSALDGLVYEWEDRAGTEAAQAGSARACSGDMKSYSPNLLHQWQ